MFLKNSLVKILHFMMRIKWESFKVEYPHISLLTETFNTTLAEFIRQILTVLLGIIFITFISWKLSLIMLAIVPLVAISTVFFGKFIKKISKEAQDQSANSNIVLLESLNGIRNVKAMVNEVFEFKGLKNQQINLTNLVKSIPFGEDYLLASLY